MWLLRNKYILYLLLLTACKSGIQVDKLALNEKIINDADLLDDDITGLMKDYASVNSGITLVDGFDLAQPTDAARMIDEVKANKHIFIELPKDEQKKDHIWRTFTATAMRLMLQPSNDLILKPLDTKEILKDIHDLNLNASLAREYFLRIADLLAAKKNHIFLINADDIDHHVPLKDFFARLSSTYLIVFANKALDLFPDFWAQSNKDIFIPNGLNPGHIYTIAKRRLLRAKANIDDATANDLALRLAKYLTALEPYTTITSLVKLFAMLNDSLEQSSLSGTIKEDMTRTLANNYKASYDFLISVNLDSKTLTDIANAIKNNYLAFNEQNYQTNEIIKNIGIYHKTKPPWMPPIEDEIKIIKDDGKITLANSHHIKREVLDIRGHDLPNMEDSLKSHGEWQKEEIIHENKKEMRTHSQNIIKANKEEALIIRQDVKKAKDEVITNSQDLAQEVITKTADNLRDEHEALSNKLAKNLADTKAELTSNSKNDHQHTQKMIKQHISDEVYNQTDNIGKIIDEHKSETIEVISNKLTTAIVAILDNQKQVIKGLDNNINQHTTAVVKKAENNLHDAFGALDKTINDNINNMQNHIDERFKQSLASILADHNQQTGHIKDHTQHLVRKEGELTREDMAQAKDALSNIIQDEVGQAITKINKIPELTKADQQRIARRLAQVIIGYVLGRNTTDASSQVGQANFAANNLFYNLTDNTIKGLDGNAAAAPAPAAATAGGVPAAPVPAPAGFIPTINSIEEAPSLEDEENLSTSYLREVIHDLINNQVFIYG